MTLISITTSISHRDKLNNGTGAIVKFTFVNLTDSFNKMYKIKSGKFLFQGDPIHHHLLRRRTTGTIFQLFWRIGFKDKHATRTQCRFDLSMYLSTQWCRRWQKMDTIVSQRPASRTQSFRSARTVEIVTPASDASFSAFFNPTLEESSAVTSCPKPARNAAYALHPHRDKAYSLLASWMRSDRESRSVFYRMHNFHPNIFDPT